MYILKFLLCHLFLTYFYVLMWPPPPPNKNLKVVWHGNLNPWVADNITGIKWTIRQLNKSRSCFCWNKYISLPTCAGSHSKLFKQQIDQNKFFFFQYLQARVQFVLSWILDEQSSISIPTRSTHILKTIAPNC